MTERTSVSTQVRVLVAEDDPALRSAIGDLIAGEPGFELVGAVADADEAIEHATRSKPDVVLVDVKMPGGGGPRAAREIRQLSPSTRVIALSAYEDRGSVLEMLRAGAIGYIVKGSPVDQIVDALRRSMRGQAALSVEVTADVIHELVKLLDRSEALTHELEALDRTKSEMIQILSHELFTPLTIIQGTALTLADRHAEIPIDEVRELAHGVGLAGQRIRRLIGNLSAAARLAREGHRLETFPLPIGDVLSGVAGQFPDAVDRIRLPGPEGGAVQVWAVLDLAQTAVLQVMENALAFSPHDSPVEVEVERRPDLGEVRVVVADRGPGILPEDRERIFGAFTQADESTTRTHEGVGIGLYLSRRIMEAHGGSIRAEGRDGGGARVVLSFLAFDPGEPDPPSR